jgi:branched-chain amino acid aminotransferase
MNECYGRKFILDGKLKSAEFFDDSLVYEGDSVYEVLRLIKGNPLFFKDHVARLSSSVDLQNKMLLADEDTLRRAIILLADDDPKEEVNLKIVFNFNNDHGNWLIYYTEPVYPTEEQYRTGVKGILFAAERNNPESKVINQKLKVVIYHQLILEGAYEALLVNKNDLITEGSRSNIFFVKGDSLITAPDNMILNGITRKHILDICSENKIKVDLNCVNIRNIAEFDSVFMTGTTPMVLPFYCIGDVHFKVSLPVIRRLRQLYVLKAGESISYFSRE